MSTEASVLPKPLLAIPGPFRWLLRLILILRIRLPSDPEVAKLGG